MSLSIELDHTIIPVTDKWVSAKFLISILGLTGIREIGPFVQIEINDHLKLDFESVEKYDLHHYAFRVDKLSFEQILSRLRAGSAPYGSGPENGWDKRCYELGQEKGVYFCDPSGHAYEIITGNQ